ncbi:glycosyltransferase family 2 protein [Shewanella sp. 0m-4]
MKYSFIVPMFNVESVLTECLDSIVPHLNEFSECIIVDDGSTDDSYYIAKHYSEEFPTLFKIIQQKNQGLSMARNHGLDIASGEYVIFVDSDDLISHDFGQIINLMDDGIYDIISYDYATFSHELSERVIYSSVHIDVNLPVLKRTFLQNVWCAPFRVYKRHLFEDCRFVPGLYYEDLELVHKLYSKACVLKHVGIVGYYYRVSPNGIMKTLNEKKLESLFIIYNKYKSSEIINPAFTFHYLNHVCKLINEYEFDNGLSLTDFKKMKVYDIRYLGCKRVLYSFYPKMYFKLARLISKFKS